MKLKNKWKRFWTLERHANHGFTLVELIVVIAILGILAGAGTAGYAGYVKHAQEKADLTTVSNILRAIEVGGHGFNIKAPVEFQGTGVKLPVGFIVLTKNNGTTTVESSSSVQTTTTGCTMSTTYPSGVVYYDGTKAEFERTKQQVTFQEQYKVLGRVVKTVNHFQDVYANGPFVSAPTEEYCSEHSLFSQGRYYVAKQAIPSGGALGTFSNGRTSKLDEYAEEKTIIFLKDSKTVIAAETNGHGEGQSADKTSLNITSRADANKGIASGVLQTVLDAAYGAGADVTLQSDNWTAASISGDVASIYSSGIQTFLGNIAALQQEHGIEDADVVKIAKAAAELDVETFVTEWKKVDNAAVDNNIYKHVFGLNGEYQAYAMRKAYNTAFASYIRQHQSAEHNTQHAADIEGFYEGVDLSFLGNYSIPVSVCRYQLKNASGFSISFKGCQECWDLYEDYTAEGGASEANARAIHGAMQTLGESGNEALAESTGVGDIYNHYTDYMDELDKMYVAADEAVDANGNKSAIVIGVFTDGEGGLTYTVSPSAADPRNAN